MEVYEIISIYLLLMPLISYFSIWEYTKKSFQKLLSDLAGMSLLIIFGTLIYLTLWTTIS